MANWEDVKGYEGLYLVSDEGEVYSLPRIVNNGRGTYVTGGRVLKPGKRAQYYSFVILSDGENIEHKSLHRLVAEAFIPNPNDYPEVNHIDENPMNNNVKNLEWCTPKHNMNYGNGAKTRHRKIDYTKPCYKENAIKNGKKASRPVVQYDKSGNFIRRYESAKDASRITNTDHSHILDCCNEKPYRHTAGGYVWKFERSDDLSQSQS